MQCLDAMETDDEPKKTQALSLKYVKIFKLNNENYYVSVHTFHSCCAMPNEMKQKTNKRNVTILCSKKRQQLKTVHNFGEKNHERQY